MPDNTNENMSLTLAVGKLTGDVGGLVRMLTEQNANSAKTREEYMKVFDGIRADNKEHTQRIEEHHVSLIKLLEWQKGAQPQVDHLWDAKNNQKGFIAALTVIGGIIGSGITLLADWWKH